MNNKSINGSQEPDNERDTQVGTAMPKTSALPVQTPKKASKRQTERSLKKKVKEIRKDGGITPLKIIVTALTAITMALLTAKLTGYVNSLALVAIISVGTAIFSETYRIILSLTTMKAQEVLKVNPDGTTETITIVSNEELEAYKNNDTDKLAEIEKKRIQTQSHIVIKDKPKTLSSLVTRAFRQNPFVRMIILFAGISLITIAATFFISNSIDQKNITYTTVEKKEEISETKRQEIINQAVQQAINDDSLTKYADEAVGKAIAEAAAQDQINQDLVAKEIEAIKLSLENLNQLQKENLTQDLQHGTTVQQLNDRIAKLESLVKTLQDEKKNNTVSNPTT